MTQREVSGSPILQGEDEQIAYALTTTPWGSSPTDVVVKLYEGTGRVDKSATMLSGAASVSGDIIFTPSVLGLTAGKEYRLEIKFTSGGNIFETYCRIRAER
jgi:hypothetical protein